MKTWKDITYDKLLDPELMAYCWHNASKGKRKRASVQKMNNSETQAKLIEELCNETYEPQLCRNMTKWDKNAKKMRDISCPAFRDQMVHWALVTLMKPHFEATFIQHNVANIPNRGLSYGNKLIKHWSQQRGTKYVLKMDVRKYYPSIPISILIDKLKLKIRDKKIISLIEKMLYKESPNGVGVTLGSYLNLWLALFYFDELDHIMKEKFKLKFYIRYVDDILVLTKTKRKAQKVADFIREYLPTIGLEIKESGKGKIKIYKWSRNRFIDMLGMKTYRNKQVLRGKTYLNIRRRITQVKKDPTPHLARSVLSYKGMAQHSDCLFFHQEIEHVIKDLHLKEVINGTDYENQIRQRMIEKLKLKEIA